MGRYWVIRGFLAVDESRAGEARALLDGFRDGGWVLQDGGSNAFLGASLDAGGRDLALARVRELARIAGEGRFFADGAGGEREQWLVARGAVLVDEIRGEDWKPRAPEVAFVAALVHEHGSLLPLLEEHLDEFAVVLPHLLLADVERWAEARLESDGADDGELTAVLASLEREFAGGVPRIRELISASFLAHLPPPDEPRGGLRSLLGPALRGRLDALGNTP